MDLHPGDLVKVDCNNQWFRINWVKIEDGIFFLNISIAELGDKIKFTCTKGDVKKHVSNGKV